MKPRGRRLSKAQEKKLVAQLVQINRAARELLPTAEARAIFNDYSNRVRFIPMPKERRLDKAGSNLWKRQAENITSGYYVPGRGFVPNRIYISMPEEEYKNLLNERKSADPTFRLAHEIAHNISRAFMQEPVEARNLYRNEERLVERMAAFYKHNMAAAEAERKARRMVKKNKRFCATYVAHADNEAFSDLTAARITKRLMKKGKISRADMRRFMKNRPYPVQIALSGMLRRGKKKKRGLMERGAEAIEAGGRGALKLGRYHALEPGKVLAAVRAGKPRAPMERRRRRTA